MYTNDLYGIIASNQLHFCYFNKVYEYKWIGFDDESGFDIESRLIPGLFGWNEEIYS